jgi:hypothetical protein
MSARDVILIGVLTFVSAIIIYIIAFAGNAAIQKMILTPQVNESRGAVQALEGTQKTILRFDYVVFGIFIGLCLALIITGWFVAGNPIFTFIYILVIVFGVAISAVLSNVWVQMTSSIDAVTSPSLLASFPISNQLMINLPLYSAIIGFLGLIVMFAKPNLVGQ